MCWPFGPFAALASDGEEMYNPADTALGPHRYRVIPFVMHGISVNSIYISLSLSLQVAKFTYSFQWFEMVFRDDFRTILVDCVAIPDVVVKSRLFTIHQGQTWGKAHGQAQSIRPEGWDLTGSPKWTTAESKMTSCT